MTKVAVAMSGGVDSSVTAALMVEKYGREKVFGVTMRLFCYGEMDALRQAQGGVSDPEKACCSIEAVNDAKAVADQLGIAHYAINLEKEFEETVIQNFVSEYQKGHTPIPCVLCNSVIKFDVLLKKVQELGADFLATGHYSKIEEKDGKFYLKKGSDPLKDQSYFLYGLTQEMLAHTLFPVGDIPKTETRRIAQELGLKTAAKKESQGICFVTEGRVTDWLREKVEIKPGEIVDTTGKKVGEHDGVIFYTVGQRKRIGGGYAEPMYVVKVDAKNNQVVIGTEKDLYRTTLIYSSSNWNFGQEPKMPHKCSAKIRYNMEDADCVIKPLKTKDEKRSRPETDNSDLNRNSKFEIRNFEVCFREPQRAITPGQSIVFYDADVVIGGGVIVESGSK